MKFLLIFVVVFLYADYSIQIESDKYISTALKDFKNVKTYNCSRIEFIKGYYVIRIGFSKKKYKLISIYKKIKRKYKNALIIDAKFDKSRIIILDNCKFNVEKKFVSIFFLLKQKLPKPSYKNKSTNKKVNNNKNKIVFPAYINYAIANLNNNLYKIKKSINKVFYRDKVEGFIKIGEIGKAYKQIYINLNKASVDYKAYKQAVDFLNYMNNFLFLTSYENSKDADKINILIQEKIKELLIKLKYSKFPKYSNSYKNINDIKEVGISYKNISFNLTKADKSFIGISFNVKKRINNLNIKTKIAINNKADESLYLLEGGKKHFIDVNNEYYLDNRDVLVLELIYSLYYTQTNKFIGKGENINFKYLKYLRFAYPNISYYFYLNQASYSQKRLVLQKFSNLNNFSVLLDNYYLIGAGINIGDRSINFDNRLLPFLNSFVNYNLTQKSIGYNILMGVKGRFFRKDNLLLGIDYSKTFNTLNPTNLYRMLLRYKYYF